MAPLHPQPPDAAKPTAQDICAFDKQGGEHHEHQLATLPHSSQAPDVTKLSAQDCAHVEQGRNPYAPNLQPQNQLPKNTGESAGPAQPLSSRYHRTNCPTVCAFDKAGGEHHEHQLATLLDRWPPYAPKLHMPQNQLPKNTKREREVEHHENQLAPLSPSAPGTTEPTAQQYAHLTRREASIMSISWLHFWTDGPPTPRSSTCRKTNCPRIQSGRGRLSITRISWPRSAPQLQVPQNQLPNSMRI